MINYLKQLFFKPKVIHVRVWLRYDKTFYIYPIECKKLPEYVEYKLKEQIKQDFEFVENASGYLYTVVLFKDSFEFYGLIKMIHSYGVDPFIY